MGDLEAAYASAAGEAEGLTPDQAVQALQAAGYNPVDEVATYYSDNGKDEGSDLLTLEELTEIADSMGDPDDTLRGAFRYLAGDDGLINKDELLRIVRTQKDLSGEDCTDDELTATAEELIARFDTNDDGMLDIEELTAAINAKAVEV